MWLVEGGREGQGRAGQGGNFAGISSSNVAVQQWLSCITQQARACTHCTILVAQHLALIWFIVQRFGSPV